MSFFVVVRTFFKKSLRKYPIVTNSLIYGALCTAAEVSQQTLAKKVLDDKNEPLDKSIIGRYIIYGTFVGGPLIAAWYRYLDIKIPGTVGRQVVRKLVIDQFFFTPQLLVVFFIAMSLMERKNDIFEECRNKFLHTFKTSCMFWIPAQTINFMLISPLYRVSYIGLCSFAWINILCWIKRQQYVPNKD